jgi:hypothetical protein
MGYVDLPDIPEGAVVSMPELEGLGVESWTRDAVADYTNAIAGKVDTDFASRINVCNSLEDFLESPIENTEYVRTLSYYSDTNSGGALYKVSNTIPDGYYEIASNGLYLELINATNVAQFGARGDGVSDDTTAIQNAIDHLSVIDFEGGKTYMVSNILIDSSNKTLNGNGCTIKTDEFKQAKLIHPLSINGTNVTVDHPESFHVNQTAMIYNANNNPKFYKIVITSINGNELGIATYKPFRPNDDSHDASPYEFDADSVIYTGTQVITIIPGMNADDTSDYVRNIKIAGFTFEQSDSNVRLESWFQIAYGIMVYHAEDICFCNNIVQEASTVFLMAYGYNKNILVEDNTFYNVKGHGSHAVVAHWDMTDISTENRAHNVNVIGNMFYYYQSAILYSSVDKGICSNNKIENFDYVFNTVIHIYGGDVSVYPSFSDKVKDQKSFYSKQIIVSNNIIVGLRDQNEGVGLYVCGVKDSKFTSNMIDGPDRSIALLACDEIDISNNTLKRSYGLINDCSLELCGAVKNVNFHNNMCDQARMVNLFAVKKNGTNEYWGYDDSIVYIENNIVKQPGRNALVNFLGNTETSGSSPSKLKDVPALIVVKNNTVITNQDKYVVVFTYENLPDISYDNLVPNQMYVYNNICSSSFVLSPTPILPFVNNAGNINMNRRL